MNGSSERSPNGGVNDYRPPSWWEFFSCLSESVFGVEIKGNQQGLEVHVGPGHLGSAVLFREFSRGGALNTHRINESVLVAIQAEESAEYRK